MSDICLSRSEIKELTGTPIRARQIQFLLKNGIRHYIDLHGRPVVTRATIEGTPAPEAVAPGTWKSNKAA
ncbi:DUF4224 domain-containing protein [Pseudoxanthomonas winnipegensis]|uniref:DUF4224 domain-containing protein n=1 Tax=Pseudoxanthomonas winnipegensis TaxID=2480810 RepID=A0ABY1WCF5_9GAMM|nr:DUF4224 domain-containing protein [Pseudoxanthomonas winnipegensis]TAA11246.1 DUF4224 domain-containing protein [Pseudoxanthomonas winnipegensis]TAA18669.1 DUF4224 domain-containing protein [Pseudoxanthomonas winnipegensis]TAH73955.1 DUF4224 domain-containing protein [Pseudoxanthomonas winnipegensis]